MDLDIMYNNIEIRQIEDNTSHKKMDSIWDTQTERQFNFTSALLLNFLPDIPHFNHYSVFKNILRNARMNKDEKNEPSFLKRFSFENLSVETENYIQNNPCIFCAWHIGAYRAINHFIAQKNIPFCLVISRQIVQTEGNDFTSGFNKYYPDNKNLQVVDAESPTAGLRILRLIKQGYSILFYIDGNTGTGHTRVNGNNCIIDFLGGKIFARTGVAFLSHLSGIPILPIISYHKSTDDNIFYFDELIFPDAKKARNEYAQNCTQRLYDIFSFFVRTYTDQWEAWLYLYKVIQIQETKPEDTEVQLLQNYSTKKFIFNNRLFGVYSWNREFYLFDKKNFVAYPINSEIYDLFRCSAIIEINPDRLDNRLLRQLYSKQVLVCTN